MSRMPLINASATIKLNRKRSAFRAFKYVRCASSPALGRTALCRVLAAAKLVPIPHPYALRGNQALESEKPPFQRCRFSSEVSIFHLLTVFGNAFLWKHAGRMLDN